MLAASLSAQAADMAMPYKAPPPAPPAFGWTGFYIGAHVGAGRGHPGIRLQRSHAGGALYLGQRYSDRAVRWRAARSRAEDLHGRLGGARHRSRRQLGRSRGKGLCNTTTFFLNCAAKTDGLATLTGRLGVDLDRTLLYVKGGGAWMHESSTISNVTLPPLVTAFSSTISNDRTGWTLGMGIEYAFAMHWSAKLEYDYMDFGTKRYNFPVASTLVPGITFTNWDLVDRLSAVKAGVNYHF